MKACCLAPIAAVFLIAVALPALAVGNDAAAGLSEEQIGQQAGDSAVHRVKDRYGLKDGFTEADLRTTAGQLAVKDLRMRFNLGPDFGADDYARAAGAKDVAELFKSYPALPPHFTIMELAQQKALRDLQFYTGLTAPISFADYAQAKGRSLAEEMVKTNSLPPNFNYADLVSVLGPEAAAGIRRTYGFDKQATHDAIVTAFGKVQAAAFASGHELADNFSAQDLMDSLTKAQLRSIKFDLGLDPAAKDEDYVVADGQLQLKLLVDRINEFGRKQRLSMQFREKEYSAAAGDLPTIEERQRYDLDVDFTEADIFNAASASARAAERIRYHLPPNFSAEQDAAAKNIVGARSGVGSDCP